MSFISSEPVLLDTIFLHKVTHPVLSLYPDYNVFQGNCKIIPLKPCVRLLLKTGKGIRHFSLFTWIIALICPSHKMNLDKNQTLCLAYTSVTSYLQLLCPVLCSSSFSSAFTQLLSTCIAVYWEIFTHFYKYCLCLRQLSTLNVPTEVRFRLLFL